MNLNLTKRNWVGLAVASTFLLGLVVVGQFMAGDVIVGVVVVLGFSLILVLLLEVRQRLLRNQQEVLQHQEEMRKENESHFEQTEALLGLYSALSKGGVPPLPKTRGWAASPDFLKLVYEQIRAGEPNLVVELGSGSSTIIGGYALQKNGSGSIISFDHLGKYAHQSRQMVSSHGLGDYCRVLESPLTEYHLNDKVWKWYSLEDFDPAASIDHVIVDGPPGHLQKLSRYPALPLLSDWFSEEVTLIIDDGDREEEKYIVEKWMKEKTNLESNFHGTEKGAYVLQKNRNT